MLATLAGDSLAYRTLLKALSGHLRAYYARRLGRSADAEDLVQETLIAIHTKRASFDPAQPFTAWFYAIARYKMIDHLRRDRRTLPLEEAAEVVADAETEAFEAARDVEQLLRHLPEHKRDLLRQVKIDGLTTSEAAEKTGLTESSVKVGIHRSLKALAKRVREGS